MEWDKMKRILIRASQSPFDNLSAAQTIAEDRIWSNLGNLVFVHSVYRTLLDEDTIIDAYGIPKAKDADYINENYDVFVLPFANAFRSDYKLEMYTRLIKKLKIPCVVVGIGYQGSLGNDGMSAEPFDGKVKAFVKAVLDKSASIGVRGEVTYNYLKRLGFGSCVDVIGCPSMFLYGNELPAHKEKIESEKDFKVIVNGKNSDTKTVKEYLFQNPYDYLFIPQRTEELAMLYWGKSMTKADMVYPMNIHNKSCMQDRVAFPLNVPKWIETLGKYDMSIGTRIHGSITGVLSGLRTCIICTDSRTMELADYHNIPHMTVNDFDFSKSFYDIYESMDFSSVYRDHEKRYNTYLSFLKKNGLEPVEGPNECFEHHLREVKYNEPVRSIGNVSILEMEERLDRLQEINDEKIARLREKIHSN